MVMLYIIFDTSNMNEDAFLPGVGCMYTMGFNPRVLGAESSAGLVMGLLMVLVHGWVRCSQFCIGHFEGIMVLHNHSFKVKSWSSPKLMFLPNFEFSLPI